MTVEINTSAVKELVSYERATRLMRQLFPFPLKL